MMNRREPLAPEAATATACYGSDAVLRHLEDTCVLDGDEIALVRDAEARNVARDVDVFAEGDELVDLIFLSDGWACKYRLLGDGRRQVINIHVPGDLIGPHTPRARCFAAALTETVVRRIPRTRIANAGDVALSLVSAIEGLMAADYEMMAERTVSLGRRNAKERMAHFLLELYARLGRVGLVRDRSFPMPLTQELIGDTLGLSVVHVNRTLRALREEGLVTAGYGRVTIHDPDGLIAAAAAEDGSHGPVVRATGLIARTSHHA